MARRSSIATRLFLLVFGFSVAWFTLTTAGQLLLEYGNTRAEVNADLEDLYLATRAGLESSLWNFDLPLVRKALESTRAVRFLSGAQVRDETGAILASWGKIPAWPGGEVSVSRHNVDAWGEPLYYQFPLQTDLKGRKIVVGSLIFSSGVDVLTLRLASGFRLILSNYLASTLGLMVILLLGLRSLVSLPLGRMTSAVQAYRFEQAAFPVLGPQARADELSILWASFETLTVTLKESWLQQRVMSTILEEAAVMALVCDAEGRIVSSNAQARTRLDGGVPGGTLGQLAYGGSSEPLFPNVGGLLGAGTSWRQELASVGDRETPYWLAVALLPLKGAEDPRARWGIMIEDISASKMTEQYRRERDLAQESARAKSLFLANLSHEIRTPMNAVVGLTSLALGEDLSPRVRGYLSPLEQSARVLLGLINDILDFSKLEEHKVVLDEVDFDLGVLVEEVGALTRFGAEEKGLTYTLSLPGPAPLLRGDPLRLRQVLVNLMSNAVKFTDAGEVRLVAAPMGNHRWRFEVTDTGIGITAADQGRLFESFTQVDPSTTRVYGGTGLGLAIVRQIVGLMGGQFGVKSTPGQGSQFWVEVPIAPGRAVPPPARFERVGLEGLRVLLAEDNKVNQLVAKEILSKTGVVLTLADNGREACDRVAAEPFDLVLMDLQMPVMDGLEATKTIRALKGPRDLPILAMTAHTYAQEREACLQAGMQDLVPKPIEPDDLYAALIRWRPEASKT